jgi:hypothetical protein
MKAALQLDPRVDIVGNRLPNVWIKSRQAGEHIFTEQAGEHIFTEQIARLARGLDERGALVIFLEGGTGPRAGGAAGSGGWSRRGARIWPNGPGTCPTCCRRAPAGARRHRGLPGRRRDLRGACRARQHHHDRRRVE